MIAAHRPDVVRVSIDEVDRLVTDHLPWFTEAELQVRSKLRITKRRREWTAGRVAAKEIIRGRHRLEQPRTIEIEAVTEGDEKGKPVYRLDGRPGRFGLSIAHCGDSALAALANDRDQRIGVDLETVCERDSSFEEVALTQRELRMLRDLRGRARWEAVTTVWVMKEAFLKALGTGLRAPLQGIALRTLEIEACTTASELFDVTGAIRHLHPLFRHFEHLAVTASTFDIGDARGAWVVLVPDNGCNRC